MILKTDKDNAGKSIAFTWRLTPQQSYRLDELVLILRKRLSRGRIDRAELLRAMAYLAGERSDIQDDLVKILDERNV